MTALAAHDLDFSWLTNSEGEPRSYISAAFINRARTCMEQFRHQYVTFDRPWSGNGNTVWGSADHAAIGTAMYYKLQHGKDAPMDLVLDTFVEHLEHEVAEGEIEWNGADFEGKTEAQNVAQIKDRGTALVAHYHTKVSPTIIPTEIEERFVLGRADTGLPLDILGYIDLRGQRTGMFGAGPPVIIERKTRSKNSQKDTGQERLQGSIYQLAVPEPVQFHLSVKLQTPKLVGCFGELDMNVQPRERTLDLIWRTLDAISHCYSVWGPEEPWPDYGALAHSWTCDYCSVRPTCHWWST